MKMTVIGTGPGAQALASRMSQILNTQVTLLESNPGKIDRSVQIDWPDGHTSGLAACCITSDPAVAIPQADIILICNLANSYPAILASIAQHITPSTRLLAGVPGAAGFDWMVRHAFAGQTVSFTVAAVESLPFIAKRNGIGKIQVHAFKQQLYVATSVEDDEVSLEFLQTLLGVSLRRLRVFLSLTLLNPNAKVHPLLFLEALRDPNKPAFQLGDEYAQWLTQIEQEVAVIGQQMTAQTGLVLDPLPSLQAWFVGCYPDLIRDPRTAQTCLASHAIYSGLDDDFLKGIQGTARDKSRFLVEEIPFGLLAFKGLANLLGVATPTIDTVIERCQTYLDQTFVKEGQLLEVSDTIAPQRFGMNVLSKLSRLYQVHSPQQTLEIKEFQDNGVVFLGKILTEQTALEIQAAVSERIQHVHAVDTEKLLLNLHWTDPQFAQFCSLPAFVTTACNLLGVEEVRIFSSLIVTKKPHEKMPVPWHQDPAYQWPIDPLECASIWFALDDVTEANGAMQMAMGGHKVGILPMIPTPSLQDGAYHFSPQLAQSIAEDSLARFTILTCDMLQYESSVHHSMMPHASPVNLSPGRRCAFIVRYCKGHTRIKLYPGMPREAFFRGYRLYNPHQTWEAQQCN